MTCTCPTSVAGAQDEGGSWVAEDCPTHGAPPEPSTPEWAKADPANVLVYHQRAGIESCTCGWYEIGKSFTAHQVAALREAGWVVVERDKVIDAVVCTTISRSAAITELPQCHKRGCPCQAQGHTVEPFVRLLLDRAAGNARAALDGAS